MTKPSPREIALAQQARLAAVVMCAAIVGWVVLGWIGRDYGWDPRYAFLIDFAALGAFAFALIVTFRVWRARQNGR